MFRRPIPVAVASLLLAAAGSLAQTAHHNDVVVIDAPAFQSADEKKPDLADATKYVFEKTNEFRKEEKRGPTAVDAKLAKAAAGFAEYMARTGRYGHTADGSTPGDRATKREYEFGLISENIAYCFDSAGFTSEELGKKFTEGWKNSPGHRRNMLDPDVTETAVAIARSEKTGYYFAVQMFARPKALAVKFTIENRSTATVSYKVGDDDFTLPPRYTRTHEQGRPTDVTFELPAGGKDAKETLKPESGTHLLVLGSTGNLKLEKMK